MRGRCPLSLGVILTRASSSAHSSLVRGYRFAEGEARDVGPRSSSRRNISRVGKLILASGTYRGAFRGVRNAGRRARAENSMFPGGFNAVLTDWQIPRLNGAKSFHQGAHARYISIAYFEYIASATGAVYQLAPANRESNVSSWRAMTNEIISE